MKKRIYIINFFLGGFILVVSLIFITAYVWHNFKSDKKEETAFTVTNVTPMPSVTSIKKKPLKIHATIPYWEQDKAAEVFRNNISHFDYLSVFWYLLDDKQKIVKYSDANEDISIISDAKKNNVKVLALITNLPESKNSDWDSDRVRKIITSPQNRKAHIQDIKRLLDAKQFDGVNIDYEELDDDLKDEFSIFIKELSAEMHLHNKLVGVAIHPKSTEFLPSEDNGSRAQDWEEIAQYADHMYFMTYGEHWNTSAAGPIASVPWDTKILAYAQRLQLPLQKVYLGTPLYALRWEEGSREGEGLSFTDVKDIQEQYDVEPKWNDQWKTPSLKYTDDGTDYVIWYENAGSVDEKIKLAEKSGIGGISFWYIGEEDPEVWSLFK